MSIPGFKIPSSCGRVWFLPRSEVIRDYAEYLMQADNLSKRDAQAQALETCDPDQWFAEQFNWSDVRARGVMIKDATRKDYQAALEYSQSAGGDRPAENARKITLDTIVPAVATMPELDFNADSPEFRALLERWHSAESPSAKRKAYVAVASLVQTWGRSLVDCALSTASPDTPQNADAPLYTYRPTACDCHPETCSCAAFEVLAPDGARIATAPDEERATLLLSHLNRASLSASKK